MGDAHADESGEPMTRHPFDSGHAPGYNDHLPEAQRRGGPTQTNTPHMKKHKTASAHTGHWNTGPTNRVRVRKTKGRPRTSVTDLKSVPALRDAYRNDLNTLAALNHLLGLASHCVDRCLSEDSIPLPVALYGSDALASVNKVREHLDILINERSPRVDAGAPLAVLAKARAASIRSRSRTSKKGGAL